MVGDETSLGFSILSVALAILLREFPFRTDKRRRVWTLIECRGCCVKRRRCKGKVQPSVDESTELESQTSNMSSNYV